jgi:hypothetical protein
MWEAAKIIVVILCAMAAPIVAIEIDIARYRRWAWFRPSDRYSSVIILLALLFCLAFFAKTWLLPFPWPGLVLPISVFSPSLFGPSTPTGDLR